MELAIETGYFPRWLAFGAGRVWIGVAGEDTFDFPASEPWPLYARGLASSAGTGNSIRAERPVSKRRYGRAKSTP